MFGSVEFSRDCQVRIKGGAIAPAPPLQGSPPWWNFFLSNKTLVSKIFVTPKLKYTRIQLYYIPMLR